MRVTLLFLFFFYISQSSAQSLWNGQGHIPEDSQVDWSNAGLLDNTPTLADHVFDVTNPDYDDDDNANYDGEIEAAIDDAVSTTGTSIIYFPAGTYNIHSTISLHVDRNENNIVFQGAGSDKTTLKFTVGSNKRCFQVSGKQTSTVVYLNFSIPKGTKSISGNGISALNVGDWIRLSEYNHGVNDDWARHTIGQITQLASINGNSATMKDEASKFYSDGNNLRFWKINPIKNIGIENLKIYRNDTGHNAAGENIYFSYAINCWIKGVESEYTSRHHVNAIYSSHIEVSGSYFNNARSNGDGGRGYGVVLNYSTTNCLIENNIFRKLRHAMLVQAGANCNVFTYNYSREQDWNHPGQGPDLLLHGNYPYSNLFEENNIEWIKGDDVHGVNGPYNTYVRNIVYDDTAERYFFITLDESPNTNVLGCWIGNGGASGIPPLQLEGVTTSLDTDLYGFQYYYEDIPYYPSNHNTTWLAGAWNQRGLKDISYYYSSRPGFLDVSYTSYSWPSCGPPVLPSDIITQSIPARGRYQRSNIKNTYLINPTLWPLSITISGPLVLYAGSSENAGSETSNNQIDEKIIINAPAPSATGTWTANAEGGDGSYSYQWYMLSSSGSTWYSINGATNKTLTQTIYDSETFKCEVTSGNETVYDTHYVEFVGGGGGPLMSLGNYPNPFNPTTKIQLNLPSSKEVRLVVYNVLGKKVITLHNGFLEEGFHEIEWNGRNELGKQVASGVYIYSLQTQDNVLNQKMFLAK